jgi:hypothetical protein
MIGTQQTSIPVLDLAVIKGIETAMLASAPHQSVHFGHIQLDYADYSRHVRHRR